MSIEEIQTAVARTAREHGPAVVGVGRGWRVGSGTVIGSDRVLASAHRVGPEGATITFADGRRESGELVAADRELDVAVLAAPTEDVEPLAWTADDSSPGIGAPVIALGNPGGRGLRATLGFVAAEQRSFRGPRGRQITGAIEHTAALPRGSSGGPLVDLDGRLLGINSIRLDGNLILALPVATLRERVESLARGEAPSAPRLGVAVAPPRVARRMRRAVGLPEREGLLVRGVEEGSPAERAGIERGDLIAAAGGQQVDGVDALYAALDALANGATLPLTVVRGTEERELQVSFEGKE